MPDTINKKDLQIILEVNKKAVEIETVQVEQNEEIISLLTQNKGKQDKMDEKLDKIIEKGEESSKDLFKIQVLFVTGLLALVAQIIRIFLKK